jgi:hypothetical protein
VQILRAEVQQLKRHAISLNKSGDHRVATVG